MSHTKSFAELVLEKVVPCDEFQTQVIYDVDGDCIEFLTSNEEFYAERVDTRVTVYYGRNSGEIIGSLIKGVRSLLESVLADSPGFRLEIVDGRVRLEHLFLHRQWKAKEPLMSQTYRRLREVAQRSNAEACVSATV